MKRRILLLAATTGYQTKVFADVAEKMGLEVAMATDRCHNLEDPWGDQALPLRFEKPEAAARQLRKLCTKPDGIVAVGDRPTVIAALAAGELGIPYNSVESVLACRSKFEARERFRSAGLPVPKYTRVGLNTDARDAGANASYPCVLKPLGLSASRGVIRANDPGEFIAAFERIRSILVSPDVRRMKDDQDQFIQVESYIPGAEYAVEGLVTDGKVQVLAIFDKPVPLEGPFFEETIYTTPSREPEYVQVALRSAVQQAVTALGLTRGPIHAEMRHNESGVWMLEVAARPIGGLCARSLRFTGGMSLEEIVLCHALGEDVSSIQLDPQASGVMMIPIPKNGIYCSVSGTDRASQVPRITGVEITAKEGQRFMKLPEGHSYLGFLFARANDPGDVERALNLAHAELQFEIATELDVLKPQPAGVALI